MSKTYSKIYNFLLEKERDDTVFIPQEMADFAEVKQSSVKTYLSKKLAKFVSKEGKAFKSSGVTKLSEEDFSRYMSQSERLHSISKEPEPPTNSDKLVIKAREAALLALDIYNRPATVFKSEGFIVMMIIAWTALFHAIFEKQGKEYFYKDGNGGFKIIDGDKKAWEL